ncbi:hypothetical protein HY448_01965 [Candidatus Pacearchaeota archaeon]|nr:hypothetical protein [Candidatus Pacearchaeota archaeon]
MKKRGKFFVIENRGAQIWIETVIYTLIALILIGAVLAFVNPKVKQIQDKSVIEQSINVMQDIDSVISAIVQGGAGNKRVVDVKISQGTLTINGTSNSIVFKIESDYEFSQAGEKIEVSGIELLTKRTQNIYEVTLTKNYTNYDVTYGGENESKSLTHSSIPYKIVIEHKGGTKPTLDFTIS